jgi:nucleotide-binding universal stress UspA family protein
MTHAQPFAAARSEPVPFVRILCAVDSSPCAAEAVRQARVLAGEDGELTVLTIGDAGRWAGLEAELLVRRGPNPQRIILDEARGHDVLVVGAHGYHPSARYLLGSTPVALLRSAPVPVLVARAPLPRAEFPRHILLATDGSPAMGPTVALTAALARRHEARVMLLHVGHGTPSVRRELAAEAAALESATGSEPVTLTLGGHASKRIAQIAGEVDAAVVVTGSRLLTGLHTLASVSQRVAIAAPCSVLVVRLPSMLRDTRTPLDGSSEVG